MPPVLSILCIVIISKVLISEGIISIAVVSESTAASRSNTLVSWSCPLTSKGTRSNTLGVQPRGTITFNLFQRQYSFSPFSILALDSNPQPWVDEVIVLPLCYCTN